MKHMLSLEHASKEDILSIIDNTAEIKANRGKNEAKPLAGQTWALIFSKSSTRTRVSFEVGIRELGGNVMFLSGNDIQLGRGEPIKDTARVLGRMVHGAVIRTYGQAEVVDFAEYSRIPTINALTDEEHPCQIIADIFTIQEKRGPIKGKSICFVGDGACNVPRSWMFAAVKLGFEFRIAAPKEYQPSQEILDRVNAASTDGGRVIVTGDISEAASGADVLYTDVWISMGRETEAEERLKILRGFQINEAIVKLAKPDALVMHCLPAYRGKEIDEATLEAHAGTIFDEAENRLHAQKSVLSWLVS